MFKKHWVFVSLLAALALFVGGFVLVGNLTRTTDPRRISAAAVVKSVSMVGTWTQTNSVDGILMTAVIMADGKISIDMNSDPVAGAYWVGSFQTSAIDGNIVSTAYGDPQLSQDTNKTFTYNDGDLSFQFSMLGQTATIHLQRSSE
jgi:hypothetical protein